MRHQLVGQVCCLASLSGAVQHFINQWTGQCSCDWCVLNKDIRYWAGSYAWVVNNVCHGFLCSCITFLQVASELSGEDTFGLSPSAMNTAH